ncbi:MAG: benzoyl-CoA 2,3-epoxidase subunit BoxB [Archangium sp.]|nr:benzoyl-CoA 2,3-epoxidase subunit BoxB [Archangium sp.]
MSNISNEKIPNNVNLSDDKKLQRALEAWQPNFLKWWSEMGPDGFQAHNVYLRTAVSAHADGWAHYDYVKMPDYRWGIFLADPVNDRRIGFGDSMGQPVWADVPGEHRTTLRRLIVTQADTEPASVEQQRQLGRTCPSLYDMRNLFQVNVEEGRHLWAMVYLLHRFFGRDGREEAEGLLERRSGNQDKPRILGTFNEPCQDWLSFFMVTYFTDRDGKFQLLALAESGFDPLSRSTRFMLTEEAHHLFVGESGVSRVIQRTCELMKQAPNEDVRVLGGIDLPTIQKFINFWYSSSLDLFGSEISTNAANFFAAGLKGRAYEEKHYTDHVAMNDVYAIDVPDAATKSLKREEVPYRNAINEVLRDDYVKDSNRGLERWNKVIENAGLSFRLTLPSNRFHRSQGIYAGMPFDLSGKLVSQADFEAGAATWLPSAADWAYVKSVQQVAVTEPGKVANWIAPPPKGIDGKPTQFEYVRTDAAAVA